MNEIERIRNFAIIAHVDHGKSTLADRFLELTGLLSPGKHEAQFLDRNPISRERGITIKLAPVRMEYGSGKRETGQEERRKMIDKNQASHLQISNLPFFSNLYLLNLIDTPGHVDFSYEVDRTLACVEGVILLVDATQGVQAQTIANTHKALEKNLVIIPTINKIDLPNAEIEMTKKQIIELLGCSEGEIFLISAKTGEGVRELLRAVIEKIPNPKLQFPNNSQISNHQFPKALIFDSYYDPHRGVVAFIRVFSGEIKKGQNLRLLGAGISFTAQEVGIFKPELVPYEVLSTGEIGYIITNLKDIHQVRVGDTVVEAKNLNATPLPGYKKVKPMVYASIFPTDNQDFLNLKKSLEKLYLNDSSLEFRSIYSPALGPGFRVGFLGLLHAEIVRERLEREFNLSLILTPPQVDFKIENQRFYQPFVKVLIVTPQKYLGALMKLIEEYQGRFVTMDNKTQITLIYEMPLSEMISNFYDRLKSVSAGYASMDWEFLEYRQVEADKMVVLLNGQPVEEFSEIVLKERAMEKARQLTKKLRTIIPRQQYEVRIQAQFKGRIIASERIAPFRKDVTQKLYGGDRTRKDKLLKKQKEGKKRMKMVGRVEIPKEAFMKLFKID